MYSDTYHQSSSSSSNGSISISHKKLEGTRGLSSQKYGGGRHKTGNMGVELLGIVGWSGSGETGGNMGIDLLCVSGGS